MPLLLITCQITEGPSKASSSWPLTRTSLHVPVLRPVPGSSHAIHLAVPAHTAARAQIMSAHGTASSKLQSLRDRDNSTAQWCGVCFLETIGNALKMWVEGFFISCCFLTPLLKTKQNTKTKQTNKKTHKKNPSNWPRKEKQEQAFLQDSYSYLNAGYSVTITRLVILLVDTIHSLPSVKAVRKCVLEEI